MIPDSVRPSRKARRMWAGIAVLMLTLAAMLWLLDADPGDVVRQAGPVWNLARDMMLPNFAPWGSAKIWQSLVDTFAMAVLGSAVGCLLALVAAWLGAWNTTPHRWIRLAVRVGLAGERSITSLFLLLFLLVALGLGPFAGAMTLAIGTVGIFGRLFADAVERVDPAPGEAVMATGASRLQVIAFGILPEVVPALVSQSLYAFEINLRTAIALGIFGAGGLGFEIQIADSTLRYRDVLGLALITILLITAAERLSDLVRRRILEG